MAVAGNQRASVYWIATRIGILGRSAAIQKLTREMLLHLCNVVRALVAKGVDPGVYRQPERNARRLAAENA
ncbi:hypothetical protein SAMN05216605_10238 [Pseudomonas abietaniphila]|jgi:hypothetical protein|uniref:Uncharacterized protein n=1 Tax=Pseudomonas abietaniphila TaxID=89065 RepID=A0A1G7U5Q1_9PSED|nr:hypothetical protein SAMN05216605_10238 [Pseudomonas abietaniphila]